jgi:hypothetical protein
LRFDERQAKQQREAGCGMMGINAMDMDLMKTNHGESCIFAPFALVKPAIIRYNSTEHRAQSTEHRAQSTYYYLLTVTVFLSEFSLFTTVDAEGA